ncbi:anaerobic ribonucleoside-triphosphate reductase [Sesbania bispinosa]|nr:anaerobic ribonucleoside-triphosphate reductase [Sesbania bispinosa]
MKFTKLNRGREVRLGEGWCLQQHRRSTTVKEAEQNGTNAAALFEYEGATAWTGSGETAAAAHVAGG